MIPILPESAWREFRGAPTTKGQNHTTHMAIVVDQRGQAHKCFVKASPPGNPMVITEALAWMLAEAVDLPRPHFAALLHLPVSKLRQHMSMDQHWLAYSHVLAFCSSAVPGRHITSRWRWLDRLRATRAFKHPSLARIAAFDTWVDNNDRHTGNFLKSKDGEYIPIDNEFVLYMLIWVASGITCAHNSLRQRARDVLTATGYRKFEAAMIDASSHHEPAFSKVSADLSAFVTAMVPDPARGAALSASLLDFLAKRAEPTWLANEVGQIA